MFDERRLEDIIGLALNHDDGASGLIINCTQFAV
jgi:hypothetical protein